MYLSRVKYSLHIFVTMTLVSHSVHFVSRHPTLNTFVGNAIIKHPWKGAYLFSPQFPCRRRRIMVSLEYLPYYYKVSNHIWQLYTLGMGKFFCMLKFDLYECHMIKNNFLKYTPPSSQFRKNYLLHSLIIWHTCSYYRKRELIRFWEQSLEKFSFMSDFLTPSNLKALNLGQPPIIFLSIAFRAIKCTGR